MDEILFYPPAIVITFCLNIYMNISEHSRNYNHKLQVACTWQVAVRVTYSPPT